jgi:eukaryotic-like serine/threonine-protein kinase
VVTPGFIALILVMAIVTVMIQRHRPSGPSPPPKLADTPFVIQRAIGRGGLGTVYLALDRQRDRKVAVKSLHAEDACDPAVLARVLEQAKLAASLHHHPNIVSIQAVLSEGGVPYVVFEFVDGKTVEQIALDRGPLALDEARAILEPVCRALEFAHERGVIHRDLKPANVMITSSGLVKVMDLGVARGVGPLYSSPEASSGVVRPEGDVYALGAMTYRLLAGRPPYIEATHDAKIRRAYQPLTKLARGLPSEVDALIAEALEPDVDLRLKTPALFRERLAALGG